MDQIEFFKLECRMIEALKYDFSLEIEPSKKNGLDIKSVAMVFQLRAVDKRKITRKIGEIEENN